MFSAFSRNRPLALGALLLLLLPLGPTVAQTEEPPPPPPPEEPVGKARLLGKIKDSDGKSPLAGVTVVAYHLSKDEFFRSEPTSKKGDFLIENLPLGYYDVAVELPDGDLYVGSTVVNLPPGGKAILVLTVAPFGPGDDPTRQWGSAATGATGAGVAQVGLKMTQKEFWKSPKGIAIIAGIGGGALLIWAASGAEDDVVEPPATVF